MDTQMMAEARNADSTAWCGAGSYNSMHPELSLQILDRKMGHIAETEAPVVATSCPSCIIQLAYGARTHNMPVRVKHVAEVMAESLGIELGE